MIYPYFVIVRGKEVRVHPKDHLEIFIPNIPRARQSMRVAAVTNKHGEPVYETFGVKDNKPLTRIKIAKFQSKESVNDFAYLKWSMVKARGPGFKIWEGPVLIDRLVYIFPRPKSSKGHELFKSTKPDLVDNLNKATFDAMKGILIADDALIVGLTNSFKIYGDEPGIDLHMILLEPA